MDEKLYPSLILGLDISTTCIGISIVYDDGVDEPHVEMISHVSPKIDKSKTGIEALILRKQVFETEFLCKIDEFLQEINCPLKKITECVIEAPMTYASGGSNAETVAKLLQFNALLSEGVYNVLGIVPYHISSYDARVNSFPELLKIRKFNRKGEIYPIKHIKDAIKNEKLTPFGSYPFDCDKKTIMMNLVCDKYPYIQWLYGKKGELRKENYDSCDSLVCILAYCNLKKYGELNPKINFVEYEETDKSTLIHYTVHLWDREYFNHIEIPKEIETETYETDITL